MIIFGISVSMIVFWLALALIFLVIEALTAGLTTIWFAGGAFVALLAALIDVPIALQIVIFFVVSICFLVFTRKIFVDRFRKDQCGCPDRRKSHRRSADPAVCSRSGQGQRTGLVRGRHKTGNDH